MAGFPSLGFQSTPGHHANQGPKVPHAAELIPQGRPADRQIVTNLMAEYN